MCCVCVVFASKNNKSRCFRFLGLGKNNTIGLIQQGIVTGVGGGGRCRRRFEDFGGGREEGLENSNLRNGRQENEKHNNRLKMPLMGQLVDDVFKYEEKV